MLRRKIVLFMTIAFLVLGLFAGYARYRWRQQHPYGWSHCCDKQLYLSLMNYADTHGGRFPAGEATPEASLSLLYPDADPYLLSGKIVSPEKVEAILTAGGKLTSSTCGWHYVEGLSRDDNPDLALFWCKKPLGHNGQLLKWFEVFTVNGDKRLVPLEDWDAFLADQQKLREAAAEQGP
jgi:hypothetical protein